ncbi:hypothetical protein [Sphingomonas quercus]|uniref:DUF4440 domain-containing protein n=1 Tax=Sphingomonas quercus TaxID=2842451 RepID=A0ABS6BG14_9SPHN|nr:hypothetical protein [Sphingomonas quercus]MBU3077235.1 hypothetical protein [Sphingomonas quercus]
MWEAERAFAALAQRDGQWTAFRATAAPDAMMFAPTRVRVHDLLADRKDPPRGSLMWWPARAVTACDASLAFSTGPWLRPGRGQGSFSTIWRRQPDGGWKWLYDSGGDVAVPAAAGDRVRATRPACRNLPPATRAAAPEGRTDLAALTRNAAPGLLVRGGGGGALDVRDAIAGGVSDDRSLRWTVNDLAGAGEGAHLFRLWTWNGAAYRLAVIEVIAGG